MPVSRPYTKAEVKRLIKGWSLSLATRKPTRIIAIKKAGTGSISEYIQDQMAIGVPIDKIISIHFEYYVLVFASSLAYDSTSLFFRKPFIEKR